MDTLQHFLRLAQHGRRGCDSSGTTAAARLANAIVSEVPRLDGAAVDGLIAFIRGTKAAPETARELSEA